MNLKVLYEDNHLIAVEKPQGLLTQGDITQQKSLLDFTRDYIKKKYNKPGNVFLGLVHRLDKPVSGVIIFAKTSKAASRLHMQFLNRNVKKYYVTLVSAKNCPNTPQWYTLENELLKKKGFSEISVKENSLSKTAKLRYYPVIFSNNHALLLIELMTGRKHQIRAQLSNTGLPISGDTKYGSSIKLPDNTICLHSFYISLSHPTQKNRIEIYSSVPDRITCKIDTGPDLNSVLKELIAEK